MSGHHSTGKCGGISGGCACHCDDCFRHYAYDLMIRDRELASARVELAAEREKTRIAALKALEEAGPRLRKAYDAFGAAGVHWALEAIAAVKP